MALNFMKRLTMGACALMIACGAMAQDKKFQSGFSLGANITTLSGSYASSHVGYYANWDANINFNEHLYLGTGLGVSIKCHNEDGIDGSINLIYGQVPVNVGGKINFTDKVGLYGQIGPYVAFGVFSNELVYAGGSSRVFDMEGVNRTDVGADVRIGLKLSKFRIEVGYELGFIDLYKDQSESSKNRNFTAGIGFMF